LEQETFCPHHPSASLHYCTHHNTTFALIHP
jgi:hypothetical protein